MLYEDIPYRTYIIEYQYLYDRYFYRISRIKEVLEENKVIYLPFITRKTGRMKPYKIEY